MTNEQRILTALRLATQPLDDDELSRRSGVAPRQAVNQICRRLELRGVLVRRVGHHGKLVNAIVDNSVNDAAGTHAQIGLSSMPGISPEGEIAAVDLHRVTSAGTPPAVLAGSSPEHTAAERIMLDLLGERLRVRFSPRRITHRSGAVVDVDGASHDGSILVECWAHQGPAKVAQKWKLVNDAAKLAWVSKGLHPAPDRLIICVSDERAIMHLRGRSWQGAAIRDLGVELEVVGLPAAIVQSIVEAQRRQFR